LSKPKLTESCRAERRKKHEKIRIINVKNRKVLSSVQIPCRPFPSQDRRTAVCGAAEQLSAGIRILHVTRGQGIRFPTGTRIKTDSPLSMALFLGTCS